MDSVVSKLMETKRAPGDYTGDDGLLYCGKCRTPKQMRLGVNPLTGKEDPTIVPTPCRCQQEAGKAADDRERRERFDAKMRNLNANGITCPGSMCHTFEDDDGQRPEITAACSTMWSTGTRWRRRMSVSFSTAAWAPARPSMRPA